jgi:DNA-binding NtrC family response regulator
MTRKILIVEDDNDFASTLAMILKLRKYPTEIANNGAQAIQLASEQIFNVCFLDIKMPGMSGIECLQKIKEILPVETRYIMMTGFRDKETLDKAERSGASRVLLKPFKMSEFIKCAEETIN